MGFPKSICASPNDVICHGIPDSRVLRDGDVVSFDVSVFVDGVFGDNCGTVCVGDVDAAGRRLVDATRGALDAAIAVVRPGACLTEIGDACSDAADARGYGVVRQYCGHGIGEYFHCAPNIPHYAGNKAKFTMKAGHIFTIEPMVNMGSWKDTHWLDGWTAVTKDGKPSAQFEHQLLMGENGVEVLTARTPDSPPLWWEVPGALNKDGTPSQMIQDAPGSLSVLSSSPVRSVSKHASSRRSTLSKHRFRSVAFERFDRVSLSRRSRARHRIATHWHHPIDRTAPNKSRSQCAPHDSPSQPLTSSKSRADRRGTTKL